MSEQNHTEEIERYLLRQMDDAERIAFDERLKTDAALRQEFDLQQSLTQQIRQAGRNDLRSRLKSIHRAMDEEEQVAREDSTKNEDQTDTSGGGVVIPVHRQGAFWKYAMAASVVLAVGLGLYLFMHSDQTVANTPQLAFIQYAPTGADRQFGVASSEADSTYPVLIYKAVEPFSRAYRFDDSLRLYGPFDVSQLRLIYKPAQSIFSLEVGEETYELQRFQPVQPLTRQSGKNP